MNRLPMLALLLSPAASPAALEALDADGWYTWQVEAAEGAPAWCCTSHACNLDGRQHVYEVCDDPPAANEHVQLYAKIESGKATRLRILTPGCAVASGDGITDLGTIDVGESFEWLRGQVAGGSGVSEDALAAIAMHRGEAPLRYLMDAANGAAAGDVREGAIFWLGQARIGEAAPLIERLMFTDESSDIRQHAAFVLSQSTFSARAEALIRQGREDESSEVRSQAWFWLSQTGAEESEEAIMQAIADDPDPEVREEAVFALSELPDERAVDALLMVLEDRRLNRELRATALFWLVQSDSDRAFASVERLLGT